MPNNIADAANEGHVPEDDFRISLDRFIWVDAFANRLEQLGAPRGRDYLHALGEELYPANRGQAAQIVAEFAWSQWPT